ncbi:hypothetical protein ONZ51_g10413 [Trametes cubensis]|uniref:Uncharacterized protein n=1 Tax=Trametes cubensis TaxID=1111947 RepID=A0AAD7TKQ6_9APHY|nr:hypothetical protein ONZ51_g10413 [Trametes cubensis]
MPPKPTRVQSNNAVQNMQSPTPPQPVLTGTLGPGATYSQWPNPANGGSGGLIPPPAPRLPPDCSAASAQRATDQWWCVAARKPVDETCSNNHTTPQASAPPSTAYANALGLIFPPVSPPGPTKSSTQPSPGASGKTKGGSQRG